MVEKCSNDAWTFRGNDGRIGICADNLHGSVRVVFDEAGNLINAQCEPAGKPKPSGPPRKGEWTPTPYDAEALDRWVRHFTETPRWEVDYGEAEFTVLTCITDGMDHLFRLSEAWLSRQIYSRKLHLLLVDDSERGVSPTLPWEHIRRPKQPDDPEHTLPQNLLYGLPYVRGHSILFWEPDDYYGPDYLQTMGLSWHTLYWPLWGEGWHRIYHVRARKWLRHDDQDWHAILAQTGMQSDYIPHLRRVIEEKPNVPWVDLNLWRDWPEDQRRIFDTGSRPDFFVGMKGLTTEQHYHPNHDPENHAWNPDTPDRQKLQEWTTPEVAQAYSEIWGAG